MRRLLAVVLAGAAMGGAACGDEEGDSSTTDDPVLAKEGRWAFFITPNESLKLRYPRSTSSVSDYTRPVTLDEATAFKARRDGRNVTLVAGPVDENTETLEIQRVSGTSTEADLLTPFDLQWFFAELPGTVGIAEIVARDAEGKIVDEYSLPGPLTTG